MVNGISNITSMDTEKLIELLPKVGVAMALSSLCKQNATRRNGVAPWQIDRTINDAIQSLQVNNANQSAGLLPMLQQALGQQAAQPAAPTVDPIAHALNKMSASFDKLAAEVRGATQP